jgi:hypothetical protein
MTANRLLRPSLLLLASLLLAPNFANAEPSLAEAIRKLDANYLSVPDLEAKDAAPKIEAGGGADDSKPAAPGDLARRREGDAKLYRGEERGR